MGYPSIVLQNQYGEVSNNSILGGSSQLRAKFTVDPTNVNGLGISSFTGQGVEAVYMHTSQTPDASNPNPANGYILAKLTEPFESFVSVLSTVTPPQSGASLLVASAGLSVGTVYVITVLGNTSQAQWEVLGVPAGVTAALGLAFVAIATSCTGTGAVQVPATAGAAVVSIQPIGDPAVGGGYVLLACYAGAGSHTHNFLVKGAQAAASTDAISAKGSSPVVIGKESATDLTSLGGTNGGVQAATPSGATVAAPTALSTIELLFTVVPVAAPLI